MRFAIVIFPGSNCDQDSVHVLRYVLGQDVIEVFHSEVQLPDGTDCVILPGGFTYGDYLRAGAIAGHSNIVGAVKDFAHKGGLVIGICNGFQILCETGLLSGTLTRNKKLNFICDEVYLKVVNNKTPFTSLYKEGEVIKLPIAHGDGRYISNNISKEQIVFQYCDKDGNITEDSNPNGSDVNIAGVVSLLNPQSSIPNVLGLMPHPERASEKILGNEDGRKLFESIIQTSNIVIL